MNRYVIATKEQEREALAKIKAIVEGLGENSYVGTAFEGCFEIAEENIDCDFMDSMKARLEEAREEENVSEETAKKLYDENEALKRKVALLEEKLEKEQEWKPYENKDNVKQADYEHLAKDPMTRTLSEEEAKELLYDWFGFAKEKIEIITTVNTYEISRHRKLRKIGELERKPLYNATDWNYIRFDCGSMSYEMCDDEIRPFFD